jgi:hypothetical protein
MSNLYDVNSTNARPGSTFGSFKAMLNRWVFGGPARSAGPAVSKHAIQARRPGATEPTYIEVSPATVNPFPETKTMPGGWDLSELMKS